MSLFDSASLVVTPNGYKEDKLYAIKPDDGSGDLVVTRATTATRVNSAGLIEAVAYNLLTYSNTFTNADWGASQATLTSGQTGYDGSSNAYKLQATGTSCYLNQGSYNFTRYQSVYAKAGNYSQISFIVGGYGIGVRFNLTNGTVADNTNTGYFTPTIESVGNGWYLCSVAVSSTAPTYGFLFAPNYVAGGNSTSGDYIYIQNAQVVTGSSAKEYFPTTDRLDVPRLDYTGGSCPSILVEPQRTNLLTRSEEFNDASWAVSATITSNTSISPDGTQNADTILGSGFIGKNILQSGIHTFSVFAKAGTSNEIRLNVFDGTSDRGIYYNLSNGTITSSYGTIIASNILSYGNGWYRISITTNNATRSYVQIHRDSAQTCFIYGAQLEAGSYATSYIPTVASSVTRNADVISKTGISDLIGQTEGTIFFDIDKLIDESKLEGIFYVSDNTSASDLINFYFAFSNEMVCSITSGGVTQAQFTIGAINTRTKIALAYKSNDFALYKNGILVGTDSSGSVPALNKLTLGSTQSGGATMNGVFNSAILWKERLSNEQLAQLTTI